MRSDNVIARKVGRLPVRVQTKLLVAFLGVVVLLVLIVALGLRALSQANARVDRLGTQQLRAADYRELQTETTQVRLLLGLRAGGGDASIYLGGTSSSAPTGASLVPIDRTILSTLTQIAPATDPSRLAFTPSARDAAILRRIRADSIRLSDVMSSITAFDEGEEPDKALALQHARAEPLATELRSLTAQLGNQARADTGSLIAANRTAYANSEHLFIGVAAASIALAVLLGLVLSWSLVGPIRRTEARLSEIASGDFTGHVDVPNRDELGSLAANVNKMNDDLGRLYGELETVSRHKSEFLATMSHELRTPLNAIIGFSEVLHEQMFGPLNERQMGYVEDVLEAGRHLLALINDILDLAKVEAGRMELDISEVSLGEILQSGLTMHDERANRAGVALGLVMDPDDIVIRADERRLRQVIFNLLSNAIRFTPHGGRIDVAAHMTDGEVEVAVTDTGPGIAPEDKELIFEEFEQVRGAPGRNAGGTGLGLPLSRKFIELHGGRLWVESTSGAGSTFRFTVPATQPVLQSGPQPATEPVAGAAR